MAGAMDSAKATRPPDVSTAAVASRINVVSAVFVFGFSSMNSSDKPNTQQGWCFQRSIVDLWIKST